MGLYRIIDRIEKRKIKLNKIKRELLLVKESISKSILECVDADEMMKAINSISIAVSEIDEIIEQVL